MSIKRVTRKVWLKYVRESVGKSAFHGEGCPMLEYRDTVPGGLTGKDYVTLFKTLDTEATRADLRRRIREGTLLPLEEN